MASFGAGIGFDRRNRLRSAQSASIGAIGFDRRVVFFSGFWPLATRFGGVSPMRIAKERQGHGIPTSSSVNHGATSRHSRYDPSENERSGLEKVEEPRDPAD
jgi:hypothetical protein